MTEKYAVEIHGALREFNPRLTIPEAGNKYYIRKASGGYNPAIAGYPKHSELDVLSNCVGYAIGRFNEIGGYGECKYLKPVNAERFIEYAAAQGLKISSKPTPGACAVWRGGSTLDGSDGAGHVAIVEDTYDDGSITTSDSGYGSSKPFWITHRKKGNSGNWGQRVALYDFLGFIENPAVVKMPHGVEWVVIRNGGEYVNVPAIMLYNRWFIQLRSIDEPLGLANVSYDAALGVPVVDRKVKE